MVAVLPRGEAIRNFVYSGTLAAVARQAEVTVLSVRPNETVWALLEERFQELLEIREIPERFPVGYLREVLETAHGRRLWSQAARERWRLRDLEADTPAKRLKRLGKKLGAFPFANPPGLALLSWAERTTSRLLRPTEQYVRLFEKLKPSLVFNGSHVHSDASIQAVQAAQWLGIPTATFLFSWDNLTSQGRILLPYTYYLVWNEEIGEKLREIYPAIRREQVFVTGTPQFDFHFRPEYHWSREEYCARVGADPSRPIVLYTTGMANHIAGEPQIVERLGGMLREMKGFGPPQLMVREYAKGPSGLFEDLKRRCPEILFPEVPWERNWLTPMPEDAYLLANMLRHAAVGINVASTISLELCMFDRPVINVSYLAPGVNPPFDYRRYYGFEHYRPVVESGAIMVAESEEQMAGMLRKALAEPDAGSEERRALLSRMFRGTLDGRCGERVAEQLARLTLAGAAARA
jgi:hypothetical protein